jgi:glyoxylase-like metal-dependent hydrolase (beta-lactamase superfamily II)
LREAGVSTRDVGLIAATHDHWDQIGCLAEVKLHTGAPLAMHAADRSSIERPHPVMALASDQQLLLCQTVGRIKAAGRA